MTSPQSARFIAVFLVVVASATTPGADARDRNASRLIPNFMDNSNEAMLSLGAQELLFSDTPIAVRNAFSFVVTAWDSFAVCDPAGRALTFWGQREELPKEVCADEQTPGLLYAYSLMRAVEREFMEQARGYKRFMAKEGFDPEDRSTDKTTAIGMANVIGTRLADWMMKDGWNSMGDMSRNHFKKRFEDYTGYKPMNSPSSLAYPLRWQPLIHEDMRIGRFTSQIHVVPFLGQIRPLLISEDELAARQAPMPYENMNATELRGKDKETMDALVKDLFETSVNLTSEQRFRALWWDNKLLSIGFFLIVHAVHEKFDPGFAARWGLGEMLAEYDALVIAWKEKRRIDAVRPETIIRTHYADDLVRAYVPSEGGVRLMKAVDWEPIIPTQPHSEYPSASACMCTSFADHGEFMMKEHMEARGLDKEVPTIIHPNPRFYPPGASEGITEVRFETMKEAGKSCGQSRLWAGVHFGPSVSAGEKLVEGIGKRAYDFVKKLAAGEVPENCWWCT